MFELGKLFEVVDDVMRMEDTYWLRKVARTPDQDDWLIDTCLVVDSDMPFETAVRHKDYADGQIIIVELYPTKELALAGHQRWVDLMTAEVLPDSLTVVSTSRAAILAEANGIVYQRVKSSF